MTKTYNAHIDHICDNARVYRVFDLDYPKALLLRPRPDIISSVDVEVIPPTYVVSGVISLSTKYTHLPGPSQ